MIIRSSRAAVAAALGLAAIYLPGCAEGLKDTSSADRVGGGVNVVSQANNVGLAEFGSSIVGVIGTYGAQCARTGAGETTQDLWGANVNGKDWTAVPNYLPEFTAPAPVAVVKGDTACELSISAIFTENAAFYTAQPPALSASYGAAIAYSDGKHNFGISAMLSDRTYSNDFTISMQVSEVSAATPLANYAAPARATAYSVTADDVPAPIVDVDMEGITTQVDFDDIITDATGAASLMPEQGGYNDQFVLLEGKFKTFSWTDADAAYSTALTNDTWLSIQTEIANGGIQAEELNLKDEDLSEGPAVRTLIFANQDKDSGLRSYQVVSLRFYAPDYQAIYSQNSNP